VGKHGIVVVCFAQVGLGYLEDRPLAGDRIEDIMPRQARKKGSKQNSNDGGLQVYSRGNDRTEGPKAIRIGEPKENPKVQGIEDGEGKEGVKYQVFSVNEGDIIKVYQKV